MFEDRYLTGGYAVDNPGWHAEDAPVKARWIKRILDRNHVPTWSTAEIGSGSGAVLAEMHKLRPDCAYTGFDISPHAHAQAAIRQREGLQFRCEDFFGTSRPPYDCLLCIDVFEHVADYLGFLVALRDRARHKVFHIPLDLSVQGVVRPRALPAVRRKLGHLHYFTKETALETLRDAGYEIEDWNYTSSALEQPNRTLRTRLANIPRALVSRINRDLAARLFGGFSIMVLAR